MPYNVEIKDVEARPIAVIKFISQPDQMGQRLRAAFEAVAHHLEKTDGHIAGPAIGYYEQLGDERFEVSAGFVVSHPIDTKDGIIASELPATRIATTMHTGPYETLPEAYAVLADRAKALGEEVDLTAPMWEEYLSDADTPPEQTQTLVCWPVKQRPHSQ